MLSWIARILMVLAGIVASWFVVRDAANFSIIQMTIALLLLTLCAALAAFWSSLWAWFKDRWRPKERKGL